MKYTLASLLILCCTYCVAGIRRHDVSEAKYAALAKQKQFDCVGKIKVETDDAGSCVLISPTLVLTAAHVLTTEDYREEEMIIDGKKWIVNQPYNIRIGTAAYLSVLLGGKSYKVKNIVVHPDYKFDVHTGQFDIALLELEQAVVGVAPAILNYQYNELDKTVTGVGYGVSGPANEPSEVNTHNKKLAGQNVIDSIGGNIYGGVPNLLYFDFDHPTEAHFSSMGGSKPLGLEYASGGGDSGGGLFTKTADGWKLIGICASSDLSADQLAQSGYYGIICIWSRVAAYTSWIRGQMQKA